MMLPHAWREGAAVLIESIPDRPPECRPPEEIEKFEYRVALGGFERMPGDVCVVYNRSTAVGDSWRGAVLVS